jgi:hypothetical protein
VPKPKFEYNTQYTLEGTLQTEEERAAAVMMTPPVPCMCPFCLCDSNLRLMRFFLPNGQLSARFKCRTCKRILQKTSPRALPIDWPAFGRWVAAYPFFWRNVRHEEFMAKLNAKCPRPWEFWQAYREIKPKKPRPGDD